VLGGTLKHRFRLCWIACFALLSTGLSESSLLWGGPFVNAQVQTVQVTIFEYSFGPKVLNITTGTTVKWVDTGSLVHTSTDNESSPYWDSGSISPGSSYSKFFGNPGFYQYYCTIHPFMRAYVNATGSVVQTPQQQSTNLPWFYIVIATIVAAAIIGGSVIYLRRRRNSRPPTAST
jgi:plastocyanin